VQSGAAHRAAAMLKDFPSRLGVKKIQDLTARQPTETRERTDSGIWNHWGRGYHAKTQRMKKRPFLLISLTWLIAHARGRLMKGRFCRAEAVKKSAEGQNWK